MEKEILKNKIKQIKEEGDLIKADFIKPIELDVSPIVTRLDNKLVNHYTDNIDTRVETFELKNGRKTLVKLECSNGFKSTIEQDGNYLIERTYNNEELSAIVLKVYTDNVRDTGMSGYDILCSITKKGFTQYN